MNSWFRRFVRDCERMDSGIRFVRIKYGHWRIYWRNAYIGECNEKMPPKGYDKQEYDIQFKSQKYYEEFEDSAKLTQEIKNFVEGYYDNIDKVRTNLYQIRHSSEHRENAKKAYSKMVVK